MSMADHRHIWKMTDHAVFDISATLYARLGPELIIALLNAPLHANFDGITNTEYLESLVDFTVPVLRAAVGLEAATADHNNVIACMAYLVYDHRRIVRTIDKYHEHLDRDSLPAEYRRDLDRAFAYPVVTRDDFDDTKTDRTYYSFDDAMDLIDALKPYKVCITGPAALTKRFGMARATDIIELYVTGLTETTMVSFFETLSDLVDYEIKPPEYTDNNLLISYTNLRVMTRSRDGRDSYPEIDDYTDTCRDIGYWNTGLVHVGPRVFRDIETRQLRHPYTDIDNVIEDMLLFRMFSPIAPTPEQKSMLRRKTIHCNYVTVNKYTYRVLVDYCAELLRAARRIVFEFEGITNKQFHTIIGLLDSSCVINRLYFTGCEYIHMDDMYLRVIYTSAESCRKSSFACERICKLYGSENITLTCAGASIYYSFNICVDGTVLDTDESYIKVAHEDTDSDTE